MLIDVTFNAKNYSQIKPDNNTNQCKIKAIT